MKTYLLGGVDIRNDKGEEVKYCALGVYLAEKHPQALEDHYSGKEDADGKSFSIYEYLPRVASEDLASMAEVIRLEKERLGHADIDREDMSLIYTASDQYAPLDLLESALAAAGVHVKLKEGRNSAKPREGYWTTPKTPFWA
ncbi:hypothetical protein ABZ470_23835 [Streptosporangium sp. NPDC020072]|uniref:hypothetical protein n=1 Tax=Streptosporangium sp. NPDC020072 TaxID=3154788 RepID=UPI00342C91E7